MLCPKKKSEILPQRCSLTFFFCFANLANSVPFCVCYLPQIDVYSFGIVMWELLTGEEPYADMNAASIIGKPFLYVSSSVWIFTVSSSSGLLCKDTLLYNLKYLL